jgi:hypothetical protein
MKHRIPYSISDYCKDFKFKLKDRLLFLCGNRGGVRNYFGQANPFVSLAVYSFHHTDRVAYPVNCKRFALRRRGERGTYAIIAYF